MSRTKKYLIAALLISTGIALSSCGGSGSVQYTHGVDPEIRENRNGPPPHAPAHGYRHKHQDGGELVYKSDIGVYVVVGYPDYYYYKDRYYRLHKGSWEVSYNMRYLWAPVSQKKIPPGLRDKKMAEKGKKHKKGKKNK